MNTFGLDKNYTHFNFEEVSIDDLMMISGGSGSSVWQCVLGTAGGAILGGLGGAGTGFSIGAIPGAWVGGVTGGIGGGMAGAAASCFG